MGQKEIAEAAATATTLKATVANAISCRYHTD